MAVQFGRDQRVSKQIGDNKTLVAKNGSCWIQLLCP